MSDLIQSLIERYPLLSDQIEKDELGVILSHLESVITKKVPGDIVEFGCYSGTTSVFLTRMAKALGSNKKLWVYDSFDGLPEKSSEDESPLGVDFKRGELRVTKADFIHNFRKSQLPLPMITKKWFHEVEDNELPEHIAFAFLDGDYYKSIRASLSLVLPRMSSGGVIIIDDYDNPALPGAPRATKDSGINVTEVKASLGIVKIH